MSGYVGKILRVNLSQGTTETETPSETFYRTYFGGRALVAYYLLKEVPRGADPLGPENKVIFSSGVLTGVPVAASGRHSIGTKSPLTGGFASGEAGGYWGTELKKAGFDAVIVEGKAEKPVYISIVDGQAEIRSAEHLWGKGTGEVQDLIKQELGDQLVRVCQIGPAGEVLVRYAAITADLRHFSGRSGVGTVMGSKNLRAIAVRGRQRVPLHDKAKVFELAKWMNDNHLSLAKSLGTDGTAGTVAGTNAAGALPTRNFREGVFEGADDIGAKAMNETILVGRETCFACPIRCKRVVEARGKYNVDRNYGGPEYETLVSLGSNCGVRDLVAVAKGHELCGYYGLDSISTGVSIGFAMECAEAGLLEGWEVPENLTFGSADAMLALIHQIGRKEGLGALLAEGVKRAAEVIGHGAEEFAIHVKGQEMPMHDPRLKHALGLGYAVSPTGADHNHNLHDTLYARQGRHLDELKIMGILEPIPTNDMGPKKLRAFQYFTNWRHFLDCAVFCRFVPWNANQATEIVRAVTGWDVSLWELLKIGERAATLARAFNVREGFTARDDVLPNRIFKALDTGPISGVTLQKETYERTRLWYYKSMGWDEEGRPLPEKLDELGVEWVKEVI